MKHLFFMASLGMFAGVLIGCYLFGSIEFAADLPFYLMSPAFMTPFAKRGHHTWDWLADCLDDLTAEKQ